MGKSMCVSGAVRDTLVRSVMCESVSERLHGTPDHLLWTEPEKRAAAGLELSTKHYYTHTCYTLHTPAMITTHTLQTTTHTH